MNTQNVPAKLRKLAFAAGIALGLSAAAASVIMAPPAASASTRFVDHGGRVLSAAHIYPIYWGEYWAPGASPTPDEITRALRTVLAGSYLAGLTQYRDIGPAVIRGSHVITTSDPPSRFTGRDIEAFLDTLFDAGVLPARDEQAVYVVTIPPGINTGEGDDLVGEHSYYQRHGHRVHYAWITDSVALEGATQTTTHEIVETLTDPEGTAIVGRRPDACDKDGWCEIADICSDAAKLDGVMVAPYWSNIAGNCVIPATPAFGASEHRASGLSASPSRQLLAHPQDAIARLGTADERRDRAATRRARKHRTTRDPARALRREATARSLRRATSAGTDH